MEAEGKGRGGRAIWLAAGLLGVVLLAGCGPAGQARTDRDPDPKTVVAVVNGDPIRMHQLLVDERIFRLRVKDLTPEQRNAVLRRSLDGWIAILLRLQEANRRGLQVEPGELERAIEAARRQYVSPAKLVEFLKQVGMTEEEWRQRVRSGVLTRKLDDEMRRAVPITDDETRREYGANPKAYTRPERVVMTLMSVRTKEEAEEVLRRLAAGEYWSQLVRQHSSVPQQRASGGAAAEIMRGMLAPPIEQAVFASPAGKYMGPVEAGGHFHIFRVEEFRPAELVPFEEVRAVVENSLRSRKLRQARAELIGRLRREAKIEIRVKFEAPASHSPVPSPTP